MALYAAQAALFLALSFFCYFRKEDLYDADPVYLYEPPMTTH